MLERFPPPPGPWCDLGCGDGEALEVLARLSGGRALGLDTDPAAVSACRRRGLPVLPGGPEALRGPGPFALVVMMDVLEHIRDDLAALCRVREALVPGGRLILSVPAHPWLFSGHDRASGHFRRYSRAMLSDLLREAGFAADFIGWQCLAGLAGAAAWRAARRVLKIEGKDDTAAGRLSAPFGRLLALLAEADGRLAAAGRLPTGLTLWAAARRG